MTINELFDLQEVIKWTDVYKLWARLGLNIGFVVLIVEFVYRRRSRVNEYVFTFYMFNVITFLLCLLLRKVPAELGFALALFGVFGILRYRTEAIKIRELTFLFIVIGLGIVNAVANTSVSLPELLSVNGVVLALTWWQQGREGNRVLSVPIRYDMLSLLAPGQRTALFADLHARTGYDVYDVDVRKVDLLNDTAQITVFYRNPDEFVKDATHTKGDRVGRATERDGG